MNGWYKLQAIQLIVELCDHFGKIFVTNQSNHIIFGEPTEVSVFMWQFRVFIWIFDFGEPENNRFIIAVHLVGHRMANIFVNNQIFW